VLQMPKEQKNMFGSFNIDWWGNVRWLILMIKDWFYLI
jgi:hypothetical protein